MAEYIEREAAHRMAAGLVRYSWKSPISTERRSTLDADDVNFGLDKIPVIEVAPVVYGRWTGDYIKDDPGQWYYEKPRCSERVEENFGFSKYCPNCGVKMDLE